MLGAAQVLTYSKMAKVPMFSECQDVRSRVVWCCENVGPWRFTARAPLRLQHRLTAPLFN